MGQRCSMGSTEEAGQTGHREPIVPADMGGPFVAASAAPRFPVLIGGGAAQGAPPGQCHF